MVNQETNFINNSGQGKNIKVDNIIAKRFNWGAFFLSFIWGIFNKTPITLIIFIFCIFPKSISNILILICSIWFGIKGNTWAWQNKYWESVEHFHSIQKKWAMAGIILIVIMLLFAIIAVEFLMNQVPEAHPQKFGKIIITNASTHIYKILEENKNQKIKCPLLSNELAACVLKGINRDIEEHNKNIDLKSVLPKLKDNTIFYDDINRTIFTSDGICKHKNDCKIDFVVNHEVATKGGTATATIYLYIDKDGYIRVKDKKLKGYKFIK